MPEHEAPQRRLRDARWAAEFLGMAVPRVYERARQGIIPHVRIGRRIMFDPVMVEEWLRNGGKALPGGWRKEPA